MKEKYVILRKLAAPPKRKPGFGAAPAESKPRGLALEVEALDRPAAKQQAQRPDVEAVAPVIPMRLIAPLAAPAAAAAAGDAWGIGAVGADATPFTGDGIIPAVLDTGIDPNHPAFAGVELVRKNFTSEGDDDQQGHGTHCAGTIFGRDVGGVRIGVARGVKKAVIGKVLGDSGGESQQIVEAIQWAVQQGANVISMSLGMDFPGYQKSLQDQGWPSELATSRALEGYRANVLLFERLAAMVRSLGMMVQATVIVAAAGNESRRDQNANFEIAVSPPAVSDGIISVAALGQSAAGLVVAPFSNFGAMVSGPGVAITSAKLGGGLVAMSGTSMATPHVAGVALLWAEKLRAGGPLKADQLATMLVASGDRSKLKPGFDPNDIGTGMVRAPLS